MQEKHDSPCKYHYTMFVCNFMQQPCHCCCLGYRKLYDTKDICVSIVALVNCAQNVQIPLIFVKISRAQLIIQGREQRPCLIIDVAKIWKSTSCFTTLFIYLKILKILGKKMLLVK